MEFVKRIKLGTWLGWLINVVTLGTGKYIATWVAVDIFGFENCGCCKRAEWLDRLTNKDYNGHCDDVHLF